MFAMSSIVIIVITTTSCVINLHGQYVLFSVVLFVISVIEHQGWCYPKRERVLLQPWLKIHVKMYKTTVMGHIFQDEWWEKNPGGC